MLLKELFKLFSIFELLWGQAATHEGIFLKSFSNNIQVNIIENPLTFFFKFGFNFPVNWHFVFKNEAVAAWLFRI
jgi:hypothetical protein